MKRLSISLPAIALALVLVGSSARSTKAASRDQLYYWYTPDDQYNDENTITDEEDEWYIYLGGVPVDEDPSGGTLLVQGYINNSDPHEYLPAVYLYAHYVY